MEDTDELRTERRALLVQGSYLLASLATIPLVAWSETGRAAKADRNVLRYQDQPKDGKLCADCWAYVPGRNSAKGTCKAIEGPVSARGWCMAYSPKQRRSGRGKDG